MNLAWQIEYLPAATRQLKKLGKEQAQRIRDFMKDRIAPLDDPHSIGEPLQDPKFKGHWRYRVGDYRLICDIQNSKLVVLVVAIGKRDKIYNK